MILADFINEALGWSCVTFIFFLWVIGSVLSSIGKAAGEVLKSDTVKQTARVGLTAFFLSLFDD